MSDTPDERIEGQLLATWSAADARRAYRGPSTTLVEGCLADEWRTNIAYREAITKRLHRESNQSRVVLSHPSPKDRDRP